ncbi:DciA family protein [Streptomyces sp. NPDC002623]
MTQHPSGIDLARAALAAARADAKTRPVQPDRKKRRTATSSSRRRLSDPMGLGGAITQMMTDRGWEPPETGGSILDQWPGIAPELVGKADAVRFEHDAAVLHLQPVSHAYATQLRLHQQQILTRIHEKTGNRSVRELRILPPGGHAQTPETAVPTGHVVPSLEAPVKTREAAQPGYRETLALALENRLVLPPETSYEEEARCRQEAALRANRLPDSQDREAYWARVETEQTARRARASTEASRQAAIARMRQDRSATTEPQRPSGAA